MTQQCFIGLDDCSLRKANMEHADCSTTNRRKMCLECRRTLDNSRYAAKKLAGTLQKRERSVGSRDRITADSRRLELRKIIYTRYEQNPCVECGEARIPCLQLDHVSDKKMKVSSLVSAAVSVETLLAEIAKCRVLCANCHAVRTSKQLNWYAWRG